MDAIILAGGRGRRMGALTANHNKGALSYQGKPSIVRAIERVLGDKSIERVLVATSYRNDTVRDVVTRVFPSLVSGGFIVFAPHENVVGDMKRAITVLEQYDICRACYICGIDVIVANDATKQQLDVARTMSERDVVALVSPQLRTAPTHTRLKIVDGIVRECKRPNEGEAPEGPEWFASLNNFAIGSEVIRELRRNPPAEAFSTSRVMERAQRIGGTIRAVFVDSFVHLGNGRDFGRSAA